MARLQSGHDPLKEDAALLNGTLSAAAQTPRFSTGTLSAAAQTVRSCEFGEGDHAGMGIADAMDVNHVPARPHFSRQKRAMAPSWAVRIAQRWPPIARLLDPVLSLHNRMKSSAMRAAATAPAAP